MTSQDRGIPRSLDDPARILGMSPLELASTAIIYAIVSPVLKGVPFAALISLSAAVAMGATLFILNRTYPPHQGILALLALLRPPVVSVMPLGLRDTL